MHRAARTRCRLCGHPLGRVGRKHPCLQPQLCFWDEGRGESTFHTLSPTSTVSGLRWVVAAIGSRAHLLPVLCASAPPTMHTNVLACIYLTREFFPSLQGIEEKKGQNFSLGTNLIFKSPDKMSHKITIFQSAS